MIFALIIMNFNINLCFFFFAINLIKFSDRRKKNLAITYTQGQAHDLSVPRWIQSNK